MNAFYYIKKKALIIPTGLYQQIIGRYIGIHDGEQEIIFSTYFSY